MFQTTNQLSCNTLFHLFWSINKIQSSFGTNSNPTYIHLRPWLASDIVVLSSEPNWRDLHYISRNWAGPTRKNESMFWQWWDTAWNRFQNMAITNDHGVCLPWMMPILVFQSLSPVHQFIELDDGTILTGNPYVWWWKPMGFRLRFSLKPIQWSMVKW